MTLENVQLDGDQNDVLYIALPHHPSNEAQGVVSCSLKLRDLLNQPVTSELVEAITEYEIVFDIGHDGKLIGVEIIT